MVSGSTLLRVWKALPQKPTPLRDLAESADLEKNTVRDALSVLIQLGLAKKDEHKPIRSEKGGWVRVEYQAIAIKTITIDSKVIEATAIESKA